MSRKKMYRCVWMSLCVLVFTLMIACVCSIKSNAIITQPKGLENQVSHTEDVSDVSKSDKVDTVSRPEVKVSEIDSETVSEKATDDTSVTADTAQPAKSSNYTVDFAYDKLQYSIKGGTTVPLSDILHRIGISGTVSDVQCSNTSLFSATQTSGSWMVTSRRAFSTTEWMRVTVDDRVHEITVTDAKDGDWEYADNADGTVTIMRYCGEDGVDMNIPDKLDDKSVTALDKDVFESYYGIKSITIPKSVTSISNDVFSWCDFLEKIEVDSENKKYLAKDGALYERNEAGDATKLICCPRNFPNKSLTLPPTVDDISNLQYCENLERIYAFKKFDDLDYLMGVDKSMLVLICEDLGVLSLKNKKRVKIVDFHEILGCEEVYTIYCNDIAEEYAISAISQELGVKITLAHDESVGIQDTDGVHSYCGSKEYAVKFVNDNGIELQSSAVIYGEEPIYTGATPTKAADAQYTYTFVGWTPAIAAVTGDATYTATYTETLNEYTVTFVDEDGTVLKESTEYAYGTPADDIAKPATPTKAATDQYTYTFDGWDPELAKVTGDATYKATYTAKKKSYTITWKNDDGSVIDTTTVEYGEMPTHADPSKDADAEFTYTFVGWTPEITEVVGDATYTATYTPTKRSYTVTWKNDDDSLIGTTTVEYGEMPTHADPSKDADAQYTYTFAGWTPKIAAVTGNAIYTAQYEKSLIDDLNGDGKVDIEDMILLSRQLVNKSANVTDQYEKSFIDDVNGDDKVYINDWAYLVEKSSCTPKNGTDNNITRSELVTVLQRCLEGVDVNEDFAVSDNKWFGISQTKLLATSLLNYIEKSRRSEGSLIMTEQSTSNNPLYDASDIKDNGKKIGEIYTFDLTLKVSDDNGKTWKEYKLNLERPEAEIIIQYPDGIFKDTDPKYVEILHFLENGTSEQIKFTFEDDGIHMKVSGLSPFAIIRWSESTDDMSSQELQEYKTDEGKVLDDSSKSEVASKSDPSSKSENEKLLADDVDYVAEREVVKTADTMTIESLLGLEMLMLLSLIGLYFSLKRKKV